MPVPVHRWWIWLSLWIWQGLEKFCVSSTIMVIKTELWTGVRSPVVRAADCRSAGPWFNSGWRHWIHTHWHVQRNNIMSPITTTIKMPMTTIPRKSVNMDPRHRRASGGLLCSSQGYYDDCSGVGHEGPCSTENSHSTEVRTRLISTVQDRSQDSSGFSR